MIRDDYPVSEKFVRTPLLARGNRDVSPAAYPDGCKNHIIHAFV
jgi:hypothetical protein